MFILCYSTASSQSRLGQRQHVITKEDKDQTVDVGKEDHATGNSKTEKDNTSSSGEKSEVMFVHQFKTQRCFS